ncbi:hypothetical protein ACVW01_001609 [Thermostichus sp. MS-CIW-19]|jgi:hypothetical protein|uniref:DUF2949 domain-containing protein n=1 Tax=unclassified Synechococcus TaxID=2626047 RepID=UPI0000694577|nr:MULTISPECIES: DUF2949 domain-containing protein [unclassified Synechococcus]MDT7944879.1 DUF2949 domain-containing protein [Cyanobacteriota bacterium PSP.bin.10]ABC99983.1 conserved hypothetical protein [Synechococcus sp. JA-3-3Ab]ABD01409.1 conserved hypothetical protein [Synechococcus sp. JA-2-3B'a(2-13)]PIK87101.1 hypothetical protein SYN63AY4M2_12140 [Synechococcus sp. 63AY4M2]PIK88021.1 hypothetical protein SYN65AY6A5_02420 [Synechococcus sp. 65AY6A5]
MLTPDRAPLLQFLQVELGIPESALTFALKRHGCEQGPLPMILWHYGLISLEQLEQIFEWCAPPPLVTNSTHSEV